MVIVLNTLMIMNVYCRYLSRNRNTQETQLFLSEQDVNLHVRHFVLTPRKKNKTELPDFGKTSTNN